MVRERIEDLLARKQVSSEMGTGDADPVLNAFIDEHLARWNTPAFGRLDNHAINEQLNAILDEILAEEALAQI